jgi:hypothetical protein
LTPKLRPTFKNDRDLSVRWLRASTGRGNEVETFSDVELIDAYRKAVHDYDAAKASTGCHVKTVTSFLVAERVP